MVKDEFHNSRFPFLAHPSTDNCDNSNQSNLCDDRLPDGRQHLKKSRSLNNNSMHLSNGLDSSETEHANDALTQEQLWNSKYVPCCGG